MKYDQAFYSVNSLPPERGRYEEGLGLPKTQEKNLMHRLNWKCGLWQIKVQIVKNAKNGFCPEINVCGFAS